MLFSFRKNLSLALAASGAVLPLQATPAQAITTWNWGYGLDNADFASGTFTTADVVPTVDVTYDILGISGTANLGGTDYQITGLSGYYGPDNTFRWDGTSLSPILATGSGISFSTLSGPDLNIYFGAPGYGGISFVADNMGGTQNVESSILNPVPGPLPLFGAAAAYSWSRQLRRRISAKV